TTNWVDRYRSSATWLAGAIALLWLVHPLQSQAVTYISGRAESLLGMLYLLCWYCVIRGASSQAAGATRRGIAWRAAAVVAGCLAMGTNEAAITAPQVILLYDRVFLERRWMDVFRKRWGMYLCLGVAAGLLATATAMNPDVFTGAAFGRELPGPWEYGRSQGGVILHYLKLWAIPTNLCFDYQWPVAYGTAGILVTGIAVAGLTAASAAAMRKLPAVGFLGLAFFLMLAPTSSCVPLADLAAEHRLYLPSAVLATLFVMVSHALLKRILPEQAAGRKRIAFAAVVVLASAWGWRTVERNRDYRSPVALWRSVTESRPSNPRGWRNLAVALREKAAAENDAQRQVELRDEAIACCRRALVLRPDLAPARNVLGGLLDEAGDWRAAEEAYRLALRSNPSHAEARTNLGNSLVRRRRWAEAAVHYEKALETNPSLFEARHGWGIALTAMKQFDEAIGQYQRALEINSDAARTHCNLGTLYRMQGKFDAARTHFDNALRLNPNYAEAHHQYAGTLAMLARSDVEAQLVMNHELKAVQLNPDLFEAHVHLARLFVRLKQWDLSRKHYVEAVRVNPDNADTRFDFGLLLSGMGDDQEALKQFQAAMQSRPAWRSPRKAVGWLRAAHENPAIREGETAVQLAEEIARGEGAGDPRSWDLLAAAFAEVDRFDDAIQAADRAIELALESGDQDLAFEINSRRQLYRFGQTFRARGRDLLKLW
ncbi:MAG: tetratricopeptide repeat protein, partial [Planctomycetales bacterium]